MTEICEMAIHENFITLCLRVPTCTVYIYSCVDRVEGKHTGTNQDSLQQVFGLYKGKYMYMYMYTYNAHVHVYYS